MKERRILKDAVSDDIVINKAAPLRERPDRRDKWWNAAAILTAAVVGFVGGVLVRRWIRWI